MVIPPEEGKIRKARDVDNNTIISDSTLRNILPPQLKKMTSQYKVMCACECCILANILHFSLLPWLDNLLKHLKDRSHIAQNRKSGEISSPIFETYNNSVRCHACNLYNTSADMYISTMCPCTSETCGIPH